jgi:hypothetical protein
MQFCVFCSVCVVLCDVCYFSVVFLYYSTTVMRENVFAVKINNEK